MMVVEVEEVEEVEVPAVGSGRQPSKGLSFFLKKNNVIYSFVCFDFLFVFKTSQPSGSVVTTSVGEITEGNAPGCAPGPVFLHMYMHA